MVTLEAHHVAQADLAIGLHVKRHAVIEILAGNVIPVFVHAVADFVEHGPHAEVADAGGTEVDGSIGGAEVEILVLAFEIALAAGKADDVMLIR